MNLIAKRIGGVLIALVLLISALSQAVGADGTPFENTHVNTGDQAVDIIAVAKTQVGYHEGSLDGLSTLTDDYTKYGVWYGEYHNATWFDYAPWCAMFVTWCAYQAGIPSSVVPYHAGCGVGLDAFAAMGAFEDSAARGGTYTPKAGDIIYYGDVESPYHVGIVSDVRDGRVYTIEGNTSKEACSEHNYALTYSEICGYGVPVYNQGDIPAPEPEPEEPTPIDTGAGIYRIHADLLNVRSEPSTTGTIVGGLWYDTIVTVEELTADGWGRITLEDGTVGWCSIVDFGHLVWRCDAYTVEDGLLCGIAAGTTAQECLAAIDSVFDVAITGDAAAAETGQTLTVKDGTQTLLAFTLVVRGDADGDGAANTADARAVLQAAANGEMLEGAYARAADLDASGTVDSHDARQLMQEFCV